MVVVAVSAEAMLTSDMSIATQRIMATSFFMGWDLL
jgi:hypothetical protein